MKLTNMNSILRKALLVGAALAVALPASAGVRVIVRPGIGFGPAYGPWGYYGYGPYVGTMFPVGRHATGVVKFDTKVKDAEIFIDNGFVGTVGQVKSLHLKGGSYDLEVRVPGRPNFDEQIFVMNGKTLHVNPELAPKS